MTEEQIKARFEAGPLCCGKHEGAVARLLEERKRLLGTILDLKVSVHDFIVCEQQPTQSTLYGYFYKLSAALAFAEESV